jgi:type II secretory pathway component PulF
MTARLTFRYKVIDGSGAKSKGVLRAEDRNEVYRQLTGAGLKPVKITAARFVRDSKGSGRVGVKEIAHLTYQFAVLLEARIPIADGLRSIADQEPNTRLRAVIDDVARQIDAGNSITDSLIPHRALFGDVYIETLRAAETSGNMISVLTRLAEMLEQVYETTKNVKSAFMYPICVVLAMIAAISFLTIVVIPRFGTLFSSRGVELPLPTQILMGTSMVVRTYWFLILPGIVGAAWLIRRAWRNPSSRAKIDTFLHRIPFIRDMLKGLAVSRFAHVLGICLQSGLSLLDSLDMSGKASGRPLLQADAQKMREQVNHGRRLAEVMLACVYLPGFARRMIASGEEAAELSRMCQIIARHYDREVDHLTKNITTVIEPLLIVGLAGIVALIALAIFMPMWNMASLL